MAKVSKRRSARSWGSKRATLKHHLDGQWVKGAGSPYERPLLKQPRVPRDLPREFHDIGEPVTLADVWPEA